MNVTGLPARFALTAGAMLRRELRAFLDLHGLAYTEYKGWLDSNFVVTVADAQQAKTWNYLVDRFRDAS